MPEIENYKTGSAVVPFTINKSWPQSLHGGIQTLHIPAPSRACQRQLQNAVSGDTFNIIYEGNTETEAGDSYTATVTGLGMITTHLLVQPVFQKNGASAICKLKIRQSFR